MSTTQSLNSYILSKQNDNLLASLRTDLLKQYSLDRESSKTVAKINLLTQKYHNNVKNSSFYRDKLSPLIFEHSKRNEYIKFKIINDKHLKFSLHIMPRNAEIPMHAHPNSFSLTIVDQGSLRVEQASYGVKKLSNRLSHLLLKNETCVGLPVRSNLHKIKALTDQTVFFSLRIKHEEIKRRNLLKQLFQKNFIRSAAYCLVMPFMLQISSAFACDSDDLPYQKPKEEFNRHSITSPWTAALSRISTNYERQVEAAYWYKKSALRGDAESQYWLGVMNFDGSGITEDDDEALKWISRSADQGYQPAEKLLSHLLTTDFVLDC